jgi:chromate transporter
MKDGRGSGDDEKVTDVARPVGLWPIAREFGTLGLTSFGGGLPAHIRRMTVRQQGWLTEAEFLEALAVAQVMPGGNVVNLAVYIGRRLRGWPGALAAVVAVVAPGLVGLFAVFALFTAQAQAGGVAAGLRGAGAAVVGLLIVNLVQVGRRAVSSRRDVALAVLTVALVVPGLLPLPFVVLLVGGVGIWLNRPQSGESNEAGATTEAGR